MRILIADTCYPAFLEWHYRQRPGLALRSYDRQWRELMGTFFGTADSYSHHLTALGHPAHEVVVNCVPLQRAWVRRHAPSRLLRPGQQRAVLEDQADWYRPDVLYVQDPIICHPALAARLKPKVRLLVGQLGSPPPPVETLEGFDLILTSFPHFVPWLRGLGIESEYLPLAFDKRVLTALGDQDRRSTGIAFVGTLDPSLYSDGLLPDLASRVPLEVWGQGLETVPADSPLRARHHGEAWGLDMYRIYHSARIVFNRHGDVAEQNANNMRLFEATGTGALLLTEEKENLATLFEPGREVVTYRTAEEAASQARYYLEHEDERAEIARRGQERTLREHTYEQRMATLAEMLEARLR